MNDPQHQELVGIQSSSLKSLAQDILSKQKQNSLSSAPLSIEWDEENWHYTPDSRLTKKVAIERLALYILAMDAINFCFWPSHTNNNSAEDNFEYEHLAMAMASMAKKDEEAQASMDTLSPNYAFAPARLAGLSSTEMASLWSTFLDQLAKSSGRPITPLDNIETRTKLWNEIGSVLVQKWEGNILNFLQVQVAGNGDLSCGLSAPQLVDRIAQNFAGFRDFVPSETAGRPLYLHKRSQICVGDWNASIKLNLKDLDKVTTFADYRVPQLLRHFGVLQYGPGLAKRIDDEEEIPRATLEECSIRAATVVAVEDLVQELHAQQKGAADPVEFTAVTVDWYLWQLGEKMNNEGSLKPHHKTRTIFY